MRLTAAIFTIIISISSVAQAASVWKVSKNDKTLYLGGTVHLLSQDDYPLPNEYEKAYKAADTLVFETDIAAMETPEFQMKAMQVMSYSGNGSIHDVLNKQTITALETHLATRGIPLAQLAKLKPGMLSLTLSMIEFQVIGLTSAGVDKFYSDKAISDKKQQNWLETPEQQLDFMAQMGTGQEDSMIMYTLKDIKNLPTMITQLKNFWRKGDTKGMTDLSITPFKTDFPDIYNELIVKRNNNWMPHIENMLTDDTVEFVLVGALHLAGEDSVIAMLRKLGYEVTKI